MSIPPAPLLRTLLITLITCVGQASSASAVWLQPTFGRPKSNRPAPPTRNDRQPAQPGDEPRPTRLPPEQDWREGDPIRRAPFAQGTQPEPGAVFAWKTDDGTRYTWSLPFDFKRGEGYDIIVILHPARDDFRWGFANHPRTPTGFRPHDIVISVDGLGGDARRPNQRLFEPSEANMIRFRDVMLQFSRQFPASRLYLYAAGGPQDGGGAPFAVKFAGTFPALAEGVLLHSARIPAELVTKSSVPFVFLHGAKDSFVPLADARESLEAFKQEGHGRARLRVLRAFNDFVDPPHASECIDYLQGMSASEAPAVLAAAERILTPKAADDSNYTTAVWYSGAYEVLERLTGSGKGAVDDTPESVRTRAQTLQDAINAAASEHVKALTPLVGPNGASGLALDGGAWLGYLLSFRDDFRGVPAAEQYIASIGLDAMLAEHAATAKDLLSIWSSKGDRSDKSAGETFARVIELLPSCYLNEALPVDLTAWMRAVSRNADEVGLDSAIAEKFEYITLLDKGWRSGIDEYRLRWRLWNLPPAGPAPSDETTPEKPAK